MQFSGNFKGKPLFWANFRLRAPLGSKLCWPPIPKSWIRACDQRVLSCPCVVLFSTIYLRFWVAAMRVWLRSAMKLKWTSFLACQHLSEAQIEEAAFANTDLLTRQRMEWKHEGLFTFSHLGTEVVVVFVFWLELKKHGDIWPPLKKVSASNVVRFLIGSPTRNAHPFHRTEQDPDAVDLQSTARFCHCATWLETVC